MVNCAGSRLCRAAVLGFLLFLLPCHQAAAAVINVAAGPDTDAANNDYRRIQDAINAAGNGDTIFLSGTFDFTAPFAAAAWALGNDNIPSTADDYAVLVPPGLNSVTLTATALGTATIQGPGDLAAVNLEGFLLFDGGDNQNWTISNLRILDFDLSIGFFSGVGGPDAFNGTTIQNNFIRIPTDLNATVAPADVNQNLGIHFSFGVNQSILDNTFHIPGDGVSDGVNLSSSVAMQSNVSGGGVYDGLTIANNVIHVLNAQSANPERILGIWENGHAHTSDITVVNNSFINDAAGNDPALNSQRAFRVTSHSGAGTAVTYDSNTVNGANIGFEWLTASNFSGNQAVVLTGNQITNSNTGVLVQSSGVAHLTTNVITGSGSGAGLHLVTGTLTGSGANTNSVFRTVVSGGSGDGIWIEATAGAVAPMSENDLSGNTGFGLRNQTAPMILAERNWWGNNLAAPVAAEVSGNADFDPWLASATDVSPAFGFQPFTHATTSGALTTFLGSGAADTGALLAGDPVTMVMNGETAFTALAQLLNFDIQLGGSDDVFTLGQTGIPTVFDGGPGNDTLVGTNVAQTWNITGAGSGNIPGAASSFSNVESLRGGTAADAFVFGAAGSLGRTLDGNLGTDTLDNSAIPASTITPTGPGTLDGFMGTATGIGIGFDNINLVAGAPADVSVTKSGAATATTGAVISYTITVTNAGPNPALDAQLTDTLPAGTTFSSLAAASGWTCTTPAVNAAGTVTCTRASVPIGPGVFTLNVNAPATPGGITNTATVASANEGAPGNESASASTTVNGIADLAITKTGAATATTGAVISYTITVTNAGPHPALDAQLTDTLPAGTTFSSLAAASGWTCATPAVNAAGTVTCTRASVPIGPGVFTLSVNAPATPGGITNTATVASVNEGAPGNESASASTTVNGIADLAITKTAATPSGGQIVYTISVSNSGPAAATSVVVTDIIPSGVAFASATPSQGSCSGVTTVTCNLGTLLNGSTATITLVVTVTATSGSVENTATVSSNQVDPTPADATATATAEIPPPIPTTSGWAFLALAAMVGLLALTRLRIRPARGSSAE